MIEKIKKLLRYIGMNNRMTTKEMEQYIEKRYMEKLSNYLSEKNDLKDFHFTKEHTRGPEGTYVFSDTEGYHYLYTERGQIGIHIISQEIEDIAYKVVGDCIFRIALDYELENRDLNKDSRRKVFAKEEELWKLMDEAGYLKKKKDRREILKKYPYNDEWFHGVREEYIKHIKGRKRVVNQWVKCRWVLEYSDDSLEYLLRKKKEVLFLDEYAVDMGFTVLKAVAYLDEFFVVLEHKEKKYISTIDGIIKLPFAPQFQIGDLVNIKEDQKGVINTMQWHFKKQSYYYTVKIGNKLKSKRYFEEELLEKNPVAPTGREGWSEEYLLKHFMIDITQDSYWRKMLFEAEFDQEFLVSYKFLEFIPSRIEREFVEEKFEMMISKVKSCPCEEDFDGLVIFKFRSIKNPDICDYSGNNPGVI